MKGTHVDRPVRIQRRRERGWKMPPNTIYVGRPSKWGNPYLSSGDNTTSALAAYEKELTWYLSGVNCSTEHSEKVRAGLAELRGKNLACWCAPDAPCHADILLRLANE